MTHSVKKEKLIVFMVGRNNNNELGKNVKHSGMRTGVVGIAGYLGAVPLHGNTRGWLTP